MAAELIIQLEKLRENAQTLSRRCSQKGIEVTAVTKVFCAAAPIVSVLCTTSVTYLGDSRLENIASYPQTDKKKMLLRISDPKESDYVVALCDASLQSERYTIEKLAQAAETQRKAHAVVLMVDLGDLREGIYYKNYPLLLETAQFCLRHPWLTLSGIGTNLTCYGCIIPSPEKLTLLCEVAWRLRRDTGAPLPLVSGGNSSSLHLLERDAIPAAVTHLRLGESIARGVETAYCADIPWLHQNAITLSAPIVEIQDKPSMPEGEMGVNAFGERPQFLDRGRRKRAILAIGRQDTDHEGLCCLVEGAEILGASSDHLILDIENVNTPLTLGESISFSLSYGSMLGCFHSGYVKKRYC